MEITIQQLSIKAFKGIKRLELDMGGQSAGGDNGGAQYYDADFKEVDDEK